MIYETLLALGLASSSYAERGASHFSSSFPLWEQCFLSRAHLSFAYDKWPSSLSLRYFQHLATSTILIKSEVCTQLFYDYLLHFWPRISGDLTVLRWAWPPQSLNVRQFPHIPMTVLALITTMIKTSVLHFCWNIQLTGCLCIWRGRLEHGAKEGMYVVR